MADAPKTILPYATPNHYPIANSTQTAVTFASPPIYPQVVILTFILLSCAGGMLLAISIFALSNEAADPFALPIVLIIIGIIAIVSTRKGLRAIQAGDSPVRFEIHGQALTVTVPQQWGSSPRTTNAANVQRIHIANAPLALFGAPVWRLHVNRATSGMPMWIINITVPDHGICIRAIEDLNAALTHAHQRDEPPLMS